MTPEQAAALRAPFSDAQIGKRPRVLGHLRALPEPSEVTT